MIYSGPSEYALEKRQSEQQRDYEEASEAFEYLLDHANHPVISEDLQEWFGNGGVTDYGPIFVALVAARDQGCEEARQLLNVWRHDYASFAV